MMTRKPIVFVLSDGKYREVPSTEVIQGRTFTPQYEDRFFIKECGYIMEVCESDWKEITREDNHEKYLLRLSKLYGEFNYHSVDTDKYSGEELIVDILTNVEDEVVRKVMKDTVSYLVGRLPESDRDLIKSLFYFNIPEAEYAKQVSLSRQTINLRKRLILRNMKKILEK